MFRKSWDDFHSKDPIFSVYRLFFLLITERPINRVHILRIKLLLSLSKLFHIK